MYKLQYITCWRLIGSNVVRCCIHDFYQDWWRDNSTIYITTDHSISRCVDTPRNTCRRDGDSVFMHYFCQCSFSILSVNGHINSNTCIRIWNITVMLINSRHIKIGILIPNYHVHHLPDQVRYDLLRNNLPSPCGVILKLKLISKDSLWRSSCTGVAILKTLTAFIVLITSNLHSNDQNIWYLTTHFLELLLPFKGEYVFNKSNGGHIETSKHFD